MFVHNYIFMDARISAVIHNNALTVFSLTFNNITCPAYAIYQPTLILSSYWLCSLIGWLPKTAFDTPNPIGKGPSLSNLSCHLSLCLVVSFRYPFSPRFAGAAAVSWPCMLPRPNPDSKFDALLVVLVHKHAPEGPQPRTSTHWCLHFTPSSQYTCLFPTKHGCGQRIVWAGRPARGPWIRIHDEEALGDYWPELFARLRGREHGPLQLHLSQTSRNFHRQWRRHRRRRLLPEVSR